MISPARELARQYKCSVGMMSKALAMMAHDGLVEQRPRLGTRVIGKPGERRKPQTDALQLEAFAFIQPGDLHEGGMAMLTAFQKEATRVGQPTLALSTGDNFQRELEVVRRLDEFDVQGVAMFPLLLTPEDHIRFSQMIMSAKFPIVLIDHCPAGVECFSVHLDCFHAGNTVTKHMLERGARKVGFITNNSLRMSGRNRYQGYLWALREAGVDPVEGLVKLTANSHPNFTAPYDEPTRFAEAYLGEAVQLGVDAVVCSNDVLAVGLCTAAQRAGLSVPNDLRIGGIDNMSVSARDDISLTSYQPPYAALGTKSFEILNRIVIGDQPVQGDYSLRGELIVRQSS